MDDESIEMIKRAGAIAGQARKLGAGMIDEGVTLLSVAEEVEAYMARMGAKPAFPTNISINSAAAHYSPSSNDPTKFRKGDLVKLDVGAHIDGWIGDTAETVEVGTRSRTALKEASERALAMAIETVSVGAQVSFLGRAIDQAITGGGYLPITNLTGHGIRRYDLHAGLTIANYDDGNRILIQDGMLLAIEPFATDGAGEVMNGKPGNIYRVLRDRKVKDAKAAAFLETVKEEFSSLPFCERWCTALDPDAQAHLRTLVRLGALFAYPVLNEIKGGMVSQTEHSILVANGSKTITTLV